MPAPTSDDAHIIDIFVPWGICLHSVSMTCDYDERPVVGSPDKILTASWLTPSKTFRVNVVPRPHNNSADCKDEPVDDLEIPGIAANGTTRGSTEDVKGSTPTPAVSSGCYVAVPF